jgi:hypothetical protein|nr:MAG TPA: hypothetical protein [Caudoviricetes sp.]
MNTITKTHLVTDVTAGGTTIHWVPTTRWTLSSDEGVAHIDVVAHTAVTATKGDRRLVATLLACLIHMGFDFDVNEDDQALEWMVGYDSHVWGMPSDVIIDHCEAALAPYKEPHPVA